MEEILLCMIVHPHIVLWHYNIEEGNSKHDLDVEQFKTTKDLILSRKIAEDRRDSWKELSKMIYSIARGKQYLHCNATIATINQQFSDWVYEKA